MWKTKDYREVWFEDQKSEIRLVMIFEGYNDNYYEITVSDTRGTPKGFRIWCFACKKSL